MPKPPKPTENQLQERNTIHALEELMFSIPEEEREDVDSLIRHFFAPGVYARMCILKAGHVYVGKIHKTEHLNIICKGKLSVSTEDGPIHLEGPCVFNARPGVKKAAYIHEDTWWINIHVTDETDPEKLEEMFIAKDYDEIEYEE